MTISSHATLTDARRTSALERWRLIRPYIEEDVPLTRLAREGGVPLRTARRWVSLYRSGGLKALARKPRTNQTDESRSELLQQVIEGLALRKPRISIAAIHRDTVAIAKTQGLPLPSYSRVYRIIRKLNPALLTLAHDGTKVYSETFDLIFRREVEAPNAMWQVDHTELDIWIVNNDGTPQRPWLTVVLDDYSRAVAGYFLFFGAPSAIQTALALRQAIWRKGNPAWHVCGIPQVLYSDHGTDFTSRHIEQVSADLKIRLVFSGAGRPRGRGKIERFFETINQVFLCHLPGFSSSGARNAKLKLPDLSRELETFLVRQYHLTPHSATKRPPQARWEEGGFLPQMPPSLEQLDLLLLTVAKGRRVHQDGIHFLGLRYIDPTLAAYVGEKVILRYDPRDIAEIRVFFDDRFLCRAICQDLAGESVALREIIQARNRRRRELRQTVEDRRRMADTLLEARRWTVPKDEATSRPPVPIMESVTLKRYLNE